MPLPAHQLLNPHCTIKPAWAAFDPGWYLARHGDARAVCQGQPGQAALLYYLRVGARLGHSPNAFFDETYYLDRNPDITELIRAGSYQSGFDHYCQHGYRGVSPHWLFDDALYADLYDDMTLENLNQHHCCGRYDHYLKSGQRERRMGQFLFDGAYYRERAIEAGVEAAEIDGPGPYAHYLHRLGTGQEELAPSIYFDPFWYLGHHPAASAAIARGRYSSAIQHYLNSPAPEHLDPVPQFSESFYRRRHPDIAAAIEGGMYRSAYQQFVQFGAFELRQPCADIDLSYYRDMHERVRNDLNSGAVRDAFAHLRLIGLKEGLVHRPPEQREQLSEAASREQFSTRARNNLAIFARRKLDFCAAGPPALSVIMVAFNRFELTMLALSSLRNNFAGPIELVLVDNDSTDATRHMANYVAGVKILRTGSNIGFLRGCNLALAHVSAPFVLFMNNDVELGHGAIAAALARLAADEKTGAVGGKIIRSNNLLQEAGSIIWNDGTTTGYMRDASPLAPEANFTREVDYCSAVFLLCRGELVRQLGGFDEAFAPAYFEDADLCVRMIEAGYRILYDPAINVYHLEFGSASTTEASMALMRRGKRIFKNKHQAFLSTRPPPSDKKMLRARSRSTQPLVLFLEDTVPLRRLGSGFVRSNDIVHAIAAAGYGVHAFPINGAPYDIMSLFGNLPDSVEILHDRDFICLEAFLEERKHIYDLIWIARTHNLARILPLLSQARIDLTKIPIILDTEAIATARDAAQAKLDGRIYDFKKFMHAEFADAQVCTKILAVNEKEVELLRNIGFTSAVRLGTARNPAPTLAPFAARESLLFVGAIHQADSPNLDSLNWYISEILPALTTIMGQPPVLHVAGYTAPEIDLSAFKKNKAIIFHGEVSDLTPLYNHVRLFIAPTRFAAGTPYKIYEAASFGLPCIATQILADQLGWQNGAEILSAPEHDANAFAHQIACLYNEEALWTSLRNHALTRLITENNMAEFNQTVAEILNNSIKIKEKSASFCEPFGAARFRPR